MNIWRRFRLWLMLRSLSPEARQHTLKEIELMATLENYSRTLRRVR